MKVANRQNSKENNEIKRTNQLYKSRDEQSELCHMRRKILQKPSDFVSLDFKLPDCDVSHF